MRCFVIGLLWFVMGWVPALAEEGQKVTARFIDLHGNDVGSADLLPTPRGVLIELDVRGLPPGVHAFHVHEKGSCDPTTSFNSAGPHFASGSEKHGYMAQGGPHDGDMPNQFVGSDGALRAHVLNASVSLERGEHSLVGPNGASLIIHAKPDDYAGQPAGNAGDRIACAVIPSR